jgi:AraC family transcriptional regulator, regulatory protein of adaptative response / methylated-DNA-[protein]-cysteine methyltransferase
MLALRLTVCPCTLGLVLVAQSEVGVSAILIGDDRNELLRDLKERFPGASLVERYDAHDPVVSEVVRCIDSPSIEFRTALDMHGSDFQLQVWTALRAIPAGATSSYTDIAIRIGRPRAVRAVAQACAANPLAVIVPCHRVLRRDGQLSGYRWGIHRKRELLARESIA